MTRYVWIALFASLLGGCGVTFSNVPEFNKGLPEDFKRRVLWNETDLFKYNLEQLAGHVIYSKASAAEYDRGPRLVTNGKSPSFKLIDNGQVYHSKVDNGAKAEGSYLAFASTMSAEQTADVSIIDTAQVFIPYEDVPVDELVKIAEASAPQGVKRYYIQGVLLASVTTRYGAKINADASGIVGDTFGAKGSVYNEQQAVGRDFRISLLLIDIDRMAMLKKAPQLNPQAKSAFIKASRADGFQIDRIVGIESAVIPTQD
ncbi:hypothetical protein KRR26_35545 [Corallococcus sp. M34]|uniref:hypothetical protein n=1 Tax=Citreicoccus inhibens TaxID=2849499 RepID=UPI001C239740|nr:hypothetical protein [Citreicoccus inhibens]MBU8900926.1 hypothetical protein [Citreicoccus inhibens]